MRDVQFRVHRVHSFRCTLFLNQEQFLILHPLGAILCRFNASGNTLEQINIHEPYAQAPQDTDLLCIPHQSDGWVFGREVKKNPDGSIAFTTLAGEESFPLQLEVKKPTHSVFRKDNCLSAKTF